MSTDVTADLAFVGQAYATAQQSAQDAIVDAVLRRLREPTPVAAVIAEEAEFDPLPESVQSAVSVSFVGSTPSRSVLGSVDWTTRVRVECYARADHRAFAHGRASRDLHSRVYLRLMADPPLHDTVSDIGEPVLQSDQDRAVTEAGCLIAEYDIQHRTARTLFV